MKTVKINTQMVAPVCNQVVTKIQDTSQEVAEDKDSEILISWSTQLDRTQFASILTPRHEFKIFQFFHPDSNTLYKFMKSSTIKLTLVEVDLNCASGWSL